jgi:hypothetical protein
MTSRSARKTHSVHTMTMAKRNPDDHQMQTILVSQRNKHDPRQTTNMHILTVPCLHLT